MQFLSRQEGKTFGQIKSHLVPEHAQSAGASAVLLLHPVIEDTLHEIEIGSHEFCSYALLLALARPERNVLFAPLT